MNEESRILRGFGVDDERAAVRFVAQYIQSNPSLLEKVKEHPWIAAAIRQFCLTCKHYIAQHFHARIAETGGYPSFCAFGNCDCARFWPRERFQLYCEILERSPMNTDQQSQQSNRYQEDGIGAEMPRYRCHKEVWALKIESVRTNPETLTDYILTPADPGYAPFTIPAGWYNKHQPRAGGYYVVYKDGYKSYSPAEAFEDGYTRI